jgi:hypothetical protein
MPFCREQLLDQRLEELRRVAKAITTAKTSIVTALDNCPHKEHLANSDKTRLFVTKIAEQAEAVAASATRNHPIEELINRLKTIQEQAQNALDFVNNSVGKYSNMRNISLFHEHRYFMLLFALGKAV